jgi:hypothetical protein
MTWIYLTLPFNLSALTTTKWTITYSNEPCSRLADRKVQHLKIFLPVVQDEPQATVTILIDEITVSNCKLIEALI